MILPIDEGAVWLRTRGHPPGQEEGCLTDLVEDMRISPAPPGQALKTNACPDKTSLVSFFSFFISSFYLDMLKNYNLYKKHLDNR